MRNKGFMSEKIGQETINLMEDIGRKAIFQAGALIRDRFGAPSSIQSKGRSDYVTNVDHESEALIMELIQGQFPDHYVMSEETPLSEWPEGVTWIVDPVDGTENFIHGLPFVAVSIAVYQNLEPLIGFVLDPMRNDLFSATHGGGAYLNGQRVHVRETRCLQEALIATGFPFRDRRYLEPYLETFKSIFLHVSDIRRTGCAALDLAYIASGRLDGFWEANLKPWDVAAGGLFIQEAGGRVCDFWGTADYIKNGHIVAGCNEMVHALLLEKARAFLAPVLEVERESI
jgi:myo-inositol-1(or 4)-monophosphatase